MIEQRRKVGVGKIFKNGVHNAHLITRAKTILALNRTDKKTIDEKGPGDAMQTAGEYINNIWLPEHKDITITDENGNYGKVIINGKIYHTGCFEVYAEEFHMNENNLGMCFFIPLKDGSI